MGKYQVLNEFIDKETGERCKVDRPAEIQSEKRAKELQEKGFLGDKVKESGKGGQQGGGKEKSGKGGQQGEGQAD